MRNRRGIIGWTSLVLLAGVLLVVACGREQPAVPPDYETLVSGSILGGGPAEPLAMVITEESELDQLLNVFPEGARPPEIDSARLDGSSAIVAVFGGIQGSSGYSVALQEIEVEGNGVALRATIAEPPSGRLVEPAEQIPYTLAIVDRSVLPASILEVVLELQEGGSPPAEISSTAPKEEESPTPLATESPAPMPTERPSSAYEILASGSLLGAGPLEPLAVVVTQKSDLDQLFGVFPEGSSTPDIDPALLGEERAIVAVFGGLRGTGGYTVTVDDVQVAGGQVVVKATVAKPPADRMVEPAEQIPYVSVIVEGMAFPTQIGDVVLELREG